ncbi:gephyrin-like isoform X2 [Linepithema humile]|uniref:gephyrin-like isoform X2 n=1 Tax=Linepithema humile TaxID=83485 RepID=UPI00351F63BB
MNANIQISIINACVDEKSMLLNLMEEFPQTFNKSDVYIHVRTIDKNMHSLTKLKEDIISLIHELTNTTDIILILSANSLKNIIIETIDEVNDAKTTIVKLIAKIPILLKPSISEFLHYSYRKNTLIFCSIADETQIINIVKSSANSMILAAYLLRNVLTICNECNHLHKREGQEISLNANIKSIYQEDQTMLCSDNGQSSSLKVEEEKDMFISNSSSNSTNPKNLQVNKAGISTRQICQTTVSKDEALLKITSSIDTKLLQTETVNIKDAFGRRIYKGVAIVKDCKSQNNPVKPSTEMISEWTSTKYMTWGETAVIPADKVARSSDDRKNEIETESDKIKYEENDQIFDSDIESGELIVHPSICMGSTEIGLLTACGWKQVNVIKEIPIGVLTIGDKLQEHGGPLQPEYSYDSNRAILISLLKENGFNSLDFGISTRNSTIIIQKIEEALKTVDLLVTTGCSNDKDCLKTILKSNFNATLYFENVNIKPGKSTAFASCDFKGKTKYILCLPGNPVSVLVTAHLFLLPLVKWRHSNYNKNISVMIKQELLLHSRPRYVWATLSWSEKKKSAEIICRENSLMNNKLSSIIDANALLTLPAKTSESDTLMASSPVKAMLIKFPVSYKNSEN